jgi:uncharacterized RDD family membrane protein YckC
MSETREPENPEAQRAVCFDRRDYAGPVRRVTIVGIDLVTAVVLFLVVLGGIWYVWLLQYPQGDLPPEPMWAALAVVYAYFTSLKRSRIRTLGYILTAVRIIDIRGGRPCLLQMTLRMVPLMPIPWSFLFDLGWVVDEPQRQTLRDKWAGTFVVRRKAKPVATAPIRYWRIGLCGIFLIYPEVGRPETSAQPRLANSGSPTEFPGQDPHF